MAWKENDGSGVPKLDFDHPRVQAAMKVTGIQMSDIAGLSPSAARSATLRDMKSARSMMTEKTSEGAGQAGSMTARSETNARGKEMWERKKLALLQELEETADALEDADVDDILSPRDNIKELAEAELGKKKAQVEQMRERLQAQLKREAQREIDRSMAQKTAAKNREAVARRLDEQKKEQREQQIVQAEKRGAQQAKAQERIKAGVKAMHERRAAITSKLKEGDERVDKMIEERTNGETVKHQEIRSRMARIAEQRLMHDDTELEKKVRRYESAMRHQEVVADRLLQAREEEKVKLEERRRNFTGKMDKVAKTQAQQDREREEAFLEHSKKMTEKHDLAVSKTKEVVEGIQAAREKQTTKFQTNKQALLKERREYNKELRSKLAESFAKADEVREKHVEETVYARAANRGLLQDIVEQNKARLQRTREIERQQTLSKIEREMAKAELASEHNRQVQASRSHVIKECMDGKQRLEELKRLDPNMGEATARRVNQILQALDMPPLPTKTVKEGEEGQQQ